MNQLAWQQFVVHHGQREGNFSCTIKTALTPEHFHSLISLRTPSYQVKVKRVKPGLILFSGWIVETLSLFLRLCNNKSACFKSNKATAMKRLPTAYTPFSLALH